jgi:hypothetical protein
LGKGFRTEWRSAARVRPNVAQRKFKIKLKFNSVFKSPSKIGSDFCTDRIAQASMQNCEEIEKKKGKYLR